MPPLVRGKFRADAQSLSTYRGKLACDRRLGIWRPRSIRTTSRLVRRTSLRFWPSALQRLMQFRLQGLYYPDCQVVRVLETQRISARRRSSRPARPTGSSSSPRFSLAADCGSPSGATCTICGWRTPNRAAFRQRLAQKWEPVIFRTGRQDLLHDGHATRSLPGQVRRELRDHSPLRSARRRDSVPSSGTDEIPRRRNSHPLHGKLSAHMNVDAVKDLVACLDIAACKLSRHDADQHQCRGVPSQKGSVTRGSTLGGRASPKHGD